MSLRFRPPPIAGFFASEDGAADHAVALAEAREEGFAEGHAAGLRVGKAAGLAEGEAQTRDILLPELGALQESSAKRERYESIAQSLRSLQNTRDADLARLENTVREVVAAALSTVFPVLLSHAAGPEIAAIVAAALTERAPETLSLRAHPDTLAAVAVETAAAVSSGRLVLIPDTRRDFASVDVSWAGGGLTFDPNALLSHVIAALAPPPIPEISSGAPASTVPVAGPDPLIRLVTDPDQAEIRRAPAPLIEPVTAPTPREAAGEISAPLTEPVSDLPMAFPPVPQQQKAFS